jgi:hypothetical protein
MPEVQRLEFEIVMDETGAVQGSSKVKKATQTLAKDTEKASKKMSGFTKMIKSSWLGVTAIVVGVVASIKKAFDFSKSFLEYRQGMDALARNTGQNADKIVSKLREVSDGTISNRDIMLAANRAVALNVTRDMDEVARLLEIARVKGKAMGIDTTQAFNDIVTGIGRGSPLILDNLGIITKGWAEEAKAAGKAMDTQFILNKILAQGADELGKAGAKVTTGAEKFQKFTATMSNLALTIGKVLTPLLLPVLDIFTKIGGFVSVAITKMAGFVSKLFGIRKEVEGINQELVKPILLRMNEKRIRQLEEGIELTKQRITQTKSLIALVKSEAAEVRNGTLSLTKISDATREYLQSQRLGKTTIDKYNESIAQGIDKMAKAQVELKGLRDEVKKQTKELAPAPTPGPTEKQVEEAKINVADYYAFVNDQRTLDLMREEESYVKALEALAQFEIDKKERESIAKEEDEAERVLRMEELMAENIHFQELQKKHQENINLIQNENLRKRKAAEAQNAKDFQNAWNTAVGNVMSTYSQGITDMIFEQQKWKKNFGEFVKDFVKGVLKMITQLVIMKGLMSAMGGLGLFFEKGGLVPKMSGGGKIVGPSHEQGGKQVEAEGGEFFVRKESVTKDTLPLLMAINKGMGNLASLSIPANRPTRGFQEGGVVNRDERRQVSIDRVEISSPEPEALFEQFMEFGEDMGVDIARRG